MKFGGKVVIDAKRPVVLVIKKADVMRGKAKDQKSCAAALAAIRQIPNCVAAKVHLGRTYVQEGNRWLRFQTPLSLRSEIIAFDRGGTFEPGEYILRPMTPTRVTTGSNTGRNRPRHLKKKRIQHIVHGVRPHGMTEATF